MPTDLTLLAILVISGPFAQPVFPEKTKIALSLHGDYYNTNTPGSQQNLVGNIKMPTRVLTNHLVCDKLCATMIIKFKVHEKSGTVYFSDELRDQGYVGEIEAIPNEFVIVLMKPGASSEAIVESLDHIKRVVRLRAKYAVPQPLLPGIEPVAIVRQVLENGKTPEPVAPAEHGPFVEPPAPIQ